MQEIQRAYGLMGERDMNKIIEFSVISRGMSRVLWEKQRVTLLGNPKRLYREGAVGDGP